MGNGRGFDRVDQQFTFLWGLCVQKKVQDDERHRLGIVLRSAKSFEPLFELIRHWKSLRKSANDRVGVESSLRRPVLPALEVSRLRNRRNQNASRSRTNH